MFTFSTKPHSFLSMKAHLFIFSNHSIQVRDKVDPEPIPGTPDMRMEGTLDRKASILITSFSVMCQNYCLCDFCTYYNAPVKSLCTKLLLLMIHLFLDISTFSMS